MDNSDYVDSMVLLQARADVVRVIQTYNQLESMKNIIVSNNFVIGVLSDKNHDDKPAFYKLGYEVDPKTKEKIWSEPEFLSTLEDYYYCGKIKQGRKELSTYYIEKEPLKNNVRAMVVFYNNSRKYTRSNIDEYLYNRIVKN